MEPIVEEKAGLKEEAAEKATEPKTRPLDYVMVRHMGYSAETKTHRAVRAGQRKQRFMLDTGRRIKAKGDRYTEVAFEDVLKNFNTLLSGIRSGAVEVCRPDNLEAMTMDQFGELGARLADDYKHDLKVDETLLEPLVGSDLTDKKVWVEKPKGKDTEITKPSIEPAVIAAEERKKIEEPVEEPKAEEAKPVETGLLDDAGEDAAESEEETLTEEQMMEMSVKDLQKLAKEYGVKGPDKLHKKKDLVDAIMEVASKEQE